MGVVAQAFPANPLPSSPNARRTSCGRCSSPASKRRSRFCARSAQAKRLIHPAFAKAGSQSVAPDGRVPAFFSAKAFHNARNPSARAIGSSHPKVGSIERKVVRPARFERARGFFVAQPMWPCPRFSEHVQTTGQNGPQGLGVVARSSATMGAI